MSVLDQSMDSQKYEEGCRQLMGNRSYLLYTLDKVKGGGGNRDSSVLMMRMRMIKKVKGSSTHESSQ